METIFGDGSQQQRSGVMGALLGAGKRLITGESLFMTVFTNQGSGKQQVAFAAPYPGKILAMDLKQLGGAADLPEGLVPLRGARRLDRHRVPAQDRRRPVRRRRLHHAEARRRRPLLRSRRRDGAPASISRPGRRCASTPAVSWRCSRRCQLRHPVRRQDQDGALRRRRAVLRHADRARAGSGCSRCRSAGWPIASTRPRPRRAAHGRMKALCSAASVA